MPKLANPSLFDEQDKGETFKDPFAILQLCQFKSKLLSVCTREILLLGMMLTKRKGGIFLSQGSNELGINQALTPHLVIAIYG